MKSLSLILFLLVVTTINAQTKVEKKEKEYLELLTLKYELFESSGVTYYTHTFVSGYKYPTIKEDYYSYGIFQRLDGLIKFYSELANLENQEDGLYKLSTTVSGMGNIHADKSSEKIKLYASESQILKYTTFTMSDIKADFETLKSIATE
jgi:hypothetical protein